MSDTYINIGGGSNATSIQGVAISPTAPTDGQILKYVSADGTWEPGTGGSGTFTAGGDLTGTSSSQQVVSLTGSAGVVTGPTTAITIGSSPATAGVIRLTTASDIRARNNAGAADITMIKTDSSDLITVGGTANAGVVVNTATSNTISLQVNSTTIGQLGATYFALGTTPASAGIIRLATASAIKTRNNANSADLNMISSDSSDVLTMGGTANAGMVLNTATGNTIGFQVNSTTIGQIGATYLSLGTTPASAGLLRFATASAIKARNNANSADLNIVSTDSSDIITIGGTANAGIVINTATSDTIGLQVNSAAVATFGATYLSMGSTVASQGTIRIANAGTMYARNAANSGDVLLFNVDGSNNVVMGSTSNATYIDSSGVINFRPSSTQTWQMTSTSLIVALGTASPVINQATKATDVATNNLKIQAQSAYASSTGTNRNGGDLQLLGGTNASGGTIGYVDLNNAPTTASTPSAGGASLPATALGFVSVKIGGTVRQIAYY